MSSGGPVPVPLFTPGGSSSGSSGGVAPLIVPNWAALALAPGVNGRLAFVESTRSFAVADSTSAAAVDGITVVANPAGGRWLRDLTYGDATWRLRVDQAGPFVPAWTIDAAAGSDEALGTPAAPLRTHAELGRRLHPSDWTLPGQVTVTYASVAAMPPSSDPLPFRDGPFAPDFAAAPFFLTIQGPAPTAKAGHGGTITAVTARVRATNTPWDVTTTGLLDATDVGLRLQITAGARAGAVTYIDRVLAANQVETSEWEIADLGPTTFADTHVTPSAAAGGDPTQVFTQGVLFVDRCQIKGGAQGSILFKDLDINSPVAADPVQYLADGGGIMWVRCRHVANNVKFSRVKEGLGGFLWGLVFELNCYAQLPTEFRDGQSESNLLNGGLYHANVLVELGAGLQWDADAKCAPRAPFSNQVRASGQGVLVVGAGSSFRSAVAGFAVGSQSLLRATTLFYGIAAVYGQGSANAGVQVVGRLAYDAGVLAGITVAGPAGVDYQLNAQAVGFRFDNPTATYLPVAGLATTWAVLAAAPPGGLGGQSHNPGTGGDIIPATAAVFP